ncbi:MAG: hypothetical protein A2W22_05660 [Candidatus Levybacteria bacterium RBG_16_35_11]|nr:MAG: hypothetical protein A2W22_05660 [Candidatus Levybacteria bacterium RBG_16_35_11]
MDQELRNFNGAQREIDRGYVDFGYAFQLLEYLEPQDRAIAELVIGRGFNRAKYLADAEMNFTYCIDDAPIVAWKKTGDGMTGLSDEDLIRILVSDQKDFAEGYGQLSSLLESPTEKFVEKVATAVDKIGNVVGRVRAQKIVEPVTVAWLLMARTDETKLWIPLDKTISRALRMPTSEMERYYRNSYISNDEEETTTVIQALANARALSDNTMDPEGSQVDNIRKKTRSFKGRVLLKWARLIIALLGPTFGMQLVKHILPPELSKNL